MQKSRSGTKARIARAAMSLFAKKGYLGTSIRDITHAAGITEAALYRHFVSKSQLAESVFLKHYETFSAKLSGVAIGPGTFSERLNAMVHLFCQSFDQDPTLYGYLLLSQHNELRKIDATDQAPHAILKNAISQAITQGEIPKQDPLLGAALVMGVVLEAAKFVIYRRLLRKKMMTLVTDLSQACFRILGLKRIHAP
jgi:AcrR family transcriptional regulator